MENIEKQIEIMSKDIERTGMLDSFSRCEIVAKDLYDEGYRKQSEGEWIDTGDEELDKIYSMNDAEYIKQYAIPADVAGQLAEEAAELAKAACKLERVIRGTNPTPVTYDEAVASLVEELSDINVVSSVLIDVLAVPYSRISDTEPNKFERWATHLRKHYGNE